MERFILAKQGDRSYINPFVGSSLSESFEAQDDFRKKIEDRALELTSQWEENIKDEINTMNDYTVYTGLSGYSLLYLDMSQLLDNKDYLEKAFFLAEKSTLHLKGRYLSFLTGDSGPLSIAAVCAHFLNQYEKENHLIKRLEKLLHSELLVDCKSNHPDELLYGRVGCLYALLHVKQYSGGKVNNQLISDIAKAVVKSGKQLSEEYTRHGQHTPPLMYEWHGSKYLAAAHGMAGIFYILLKVKRFLDSDTLEKYVRPSLDFLLEKRFPGGNFPSSLENDRDRLVQWCHGAPGFTHCLTEAARVFQSNTYLEAAKQCAEVVWTRGILTKGFSLCHGVAGNAFSFLHLYQVTNDSTYLIRAYKFAEIIMDAPADAFHTPDHPNSLYEGMAGVIHFMWSLLHPHKACFPGYQLL